MKILLIGGNGLIGTNIFRSLYKKKEYQVYLLLRSKYILNKYLKNLKNIKKIQLDKFDDVSKLKSSIIKIKPDLIINCSGITKHNPNIKNIRDVIYLNSIFPRNLSKICTLFQIRLIHLSSDCIFLGDVGMYNENSIPNAQDIYGITKSMGEIDENNQLTIRTSTIGHEVETSYGLLNWFLKEKECLGFTNAIFSGPTTFELSRIITDIVIPNKNLKGILNISADPIDKYNLLKIIQKVYSLKNSIKPYDGVKINRSLDSTKFRSMTNYHVKNWESMISEMYQDQISNPFYV